MLVEFSVRERDVGVTGTMGKVRTGGYVYRGGGRGRRNGMILVER